MTVGQLRLVVEADDLEAAIDFYRDALGLAEEFDITGPRGERVVCLNAGRATLELINAAQRDYIDHVEVGKAVAPRIRVAFEVDDVEATTSTLEKKGASLIARPTLTPWKSRNSRLSAPAGLQLTLFEEP